MNAISRTCPAVRLSSQAMKPNLDAMQVMFEENGRDLVLKFLDHTFQNKFGMKLAFGGNTLESEGYIWCYEGLVTIRIDPEPTREETMNRLLLVIAVIIAQCCRTEYLGPFHDDDVVIISDDSPDECPCSQCCGAAAA